MENSTLDMLKQIYGAAITPVAVKDINSDIIWKNPAAEACEFFCDNNAIERVVSCEGVNSVYLNGDYHLFNVIRLDTDDSKLIVEYIGKDNSRNIADMKGYFSFLCTRLRESASQISMAADDIDLSVKGGEENIAPSLNRIERNVKLLLKEALIPETVFYASDPYCRDNPINLAHNVALYAADAEKTLGKLSETEQNGADDICAAVNNTVFETILAYMTSEVCCGELFPEKVEFNVHRDKDNEIRGIVSVRSINISGKKNSLFNLEPLKQNSFFIDTAFKDILAEKYGISFEHINHPDGIECIMHLDILPAGMGIVKNDPRTPVRQDRFSDMSVALSEKHCTEHYKNIKMN